VLEFATSSDWTSTILSIESRPRKPAKHVRDEWVNRSQNLELEDAVSDDNWELGDEESIEIEAKDVKDEEDLEVDGMGSEENMVYP
jgi:hypothetical protein